MGLTKNYTNKKVLNAEKIQYDGMEFDSLLEKNCYVWLKSLNVDFEYNNTVHLTYEEGFKPTVPFYQPRNKKSTRVFKDRPIFGSMECDKTYRRPHTYKPDFILYLNDITVYLETKGFETDQWKLRLPLIRKSLESSPIKDSIVFAVIKSRQNLLDLLDALNYEYNTERSIQK